MAKITKPFYALSEDGRNYIRICLKYKKPCYIYSIRGRSLFVSILAPDDITLSRQRGLKLAYVIKPV